MSDLDDQPVCDLPEQPGLELLSRAELGNLLEELPFGIYALDSDWRFTLVNRHAASIWAKTREQLIGNAIGTIFPAWPDSTAHEAHLSARKSGNPRALQTICPISGLPIEMTILPRKRALIACFRDLTARRLLERELEDIRDTLDLAERSAGVGVWDMDMLTQLVRGKPQFFRNLGLEPTNRPVPIEKIRAIRHPEDRDRVIADFQNAISSGKDHYEVEYRIIRPDGEVRWIFGRGRVIRDDQGSVIRYTGADIDITERKRAEAALRESDARYRSLVENANDLVFTLDLDLRITSANPAVKRILGYSPEEIIGTTLDRYVPAEQIEKHKAMLLRKLSGEATETRYEMQAFDRLGRVRTIETSSKLSRDGDGTPNGVHAIARDITERKQYEEHLALTTRELSHRTKNILAVVQAMVQQIGRRTRSFPEFEARLAGCMAALSHSHDLLVDSNWEGASLHELVERQLAPFNLDEHQIVANGPAVSLRPQATQLIGLALHELATNASKYGALSSSTGRVRIEWGAIDGGALEIAWQEENGPPVQPPTRKGFGSTVLERMAASLEGQVSFEFPPEGVRWRLVVGPFHLVPAELRSP